MDDTPAWTRELLTERRMRDEFMARHPESPFIAGRVPFHPLLYFPPDARFRVTARLERVPVPEEAYLRTNRDNQAVMRYLGDLSFRIGDQPLRLRLYHAGEGVGRSVFVPFRDRTCGAETYGHGRYLTLELNESDEYELDFNRAFNPYCAYTDEYECGFPPAENDLPVAVRAGERVWAAEVGPGTGARRAAPSPSSHAVKGGRRRSRSRPARTGPRPRRGSARGRGSSPSRRPARAAGGSARRGEGSRTSRRT